MAVQQEIKSQLAKLLATEDIVVEHKSCETAQFNVHTRVLTLPLWEKASNEVYDMLVGHEVGHALYTPDEWDWQDEIPHQFMNVVEDARIEKLIKRKYMGLAKTFYKAYNELDKKDFLDSIKKDSTKEMLKNLTSDAFEKDIFGAPTFVVNNKIFWGQDRLDYALDEYNS